MEKAGSAFNAFAIFRFLVNYDSFGVAPTIQALIAFYDNTLVFLIGEPIAVIIAHVLILFSFDLDVSPNLVLFYLLIAATTARSLLRNKETLVILEEWPPVEWVSAAGIGILWFPILIISPLILWFAKRDTQEIKAWKKELRGLRRDIEARPTAVDSSMMHMRIAGLEAFIDSEGVRLASGMISFLGDWFHQAGWVLLMLGILALINFQMLRP
ncbi:MULTISPECIES: hypothetical protein [Alphaproteobacteria]|uniref:hypothetical protein n=1 Tax=Alphaproteobacteria TaxID=28211 RepID=UPI003263C63E